MHRRWFFIFFIVSGFCSLVDEVVWLRLAMAAFGVTTTLVSIVLSVFMAGLALGSWVGGRLAPRLSGGDPRRALRAYAVVELVIGLSGLLVPMEIGWGRTWLSASSAMGTWGSALHSLASGAVLTAVMLPFCAAMGATFPLALEAIRRAEPAASARSFSALYLANVLGAAAGTLGSALVFIELWGFRKTLFLAAALNGVLAASAFWLSGRKGATGARSDRAAGEAVGSVTGAAAGGGDLGRAGIREGRRPADRRDAQRTAAGMSTGSAIAAPSEWGWTPWLLFTTGLTSMGMEVVWVRQFSPIIGTVVYAFASILAIYLCATFVGSVLYRQRPDLFRGPVVSRTGLVLWSAAALAALLPLATADPRLGSGVFDLVSLWRVALGIGPVCIAFGALTPMLVDSGSGGIPGRAGSLYAVNVLGCIVGPLAASFLLLPRLGERWSLVALALPVLAGAVAAGRSSGAAGKRRPDRSGRTLHHWAPAAAALLALPLLAWTRDFETIYQPRLVRRDRTATVIATEKRTQKLLVVNGSGMTVLTPATKMMAHLPLALHTGRPRSALVICFGMGTSFRSALTWDIPVTAVELVPSVPELFEYFHPDAKKVLASPGARIVVDDGRRYLERTAERYDVITIDPPPPVEAAGSSLLYTREFLELVRSRLTPDGVAQVWLPKTDAFVVGSVAQAIKESFPYVRVFISHQAPGAHFLASARPIPSTTAADLARRMPARAAADMVEWSAGSTPEAEFSKLLEGERRLEVALAGAPKAAMMQDDRPVNEYYLLRRTFGIR